MRAALFLDYDVKWEFAIKCVGEIEAVNADNILSATKRGQSIFVEPGMADEHAARPRGFLPDLPLEAVKVCGTRSSILPLCLDEIDIVVQHKTTINLLAGDPKSLARFHPERVENAGKKFLERIAARDWLHNGNRHQCVV